LKNTVFLQVIKMKNKKTTDPIERLSNFAFTMSILGICTVGICPAFGAMGVAVPLVMKLKGAQIPENIRSKNKKAFIGGIIALLLFVVDIVLIVALKDKIG